MKAVKIRYSIYSLENIRSITVEGSSSCKIIFTYTDDHVEKSPFITEKEVDELIDKIYSTLKS